MYSKGRLHTPFYPSFALVHIPVQNFWYSCKSKGHAAPWLEFHTCGPPCSPTTRSKLMIRTQPSGCLKEGWVSMLLGTPHPIYMAITGSSLFVWESPAFDIDKLRSMITPCHIKEHRSHQINFAVVTDLNHHRSTYPNKEQRKQAHLWKLVSIFESSFWSC